MLCMFILFNYGTKNLTFKKTKLTLKSLKNASTYTKIYTLCNNLLEVMQLLYITIFRTTYNLQVFRGRSILYVSMNVRERARAYISDIQIFNILMANDVILASQIKPLKR